MGGGEWGVTQVAPDVLCGFQTLGIEAFGVHLKAAVIAITLCDGALQSLVMRPLQAQLFAEQVAQFGSQAGAGKWPISTQALSLSPPLVITRWTWSLKPRSRPKV